MGVNLVTRVRNFAISTQTFSATDHDVQDGCVTPGTHRIMRFDFLSYNAGNSDLVIGSPASRPDLFVWSAGHGHYHLRDFNEFLLFNTQGQLATIGYKQAFCAIDIERISPTASASPRFDNCNSDQGISAGWADVYSAGLPCQYIVIDGLPDGDYTLQSRTNAQHVVAEDCFGDNTEWTGLRFQGNNVTQIDPPWIPEDRIAFNRANLSVAQFAGRWKVVEGSHWMIDTGASQANAQRVLDIINHYKLKSMCFVGRPTCGDLQPMMYWLDDNGAAPQGQVPGEDCIEFDPANLSVTEIGGRWKVVEGAHWLLDFGPGHGNAVAALHFIRKYGFNCICFVGRPHPPMTYFKRRVHAQRHLEVLDPRVIAALIDPPTWWHHQREMVARVETVVDFAARQVADATEAFAAVGMKLKMEGRGGARIVEQYGIRGLLVSGRCEIALAAPASEIDLLVAPLGRAAKVTATGKGAEKVSAESDERPRQVELLRLLGRALDRVVIETADETLLVRIVVPGHHRGEAEAGKPKREPAEA